MKRALALALAASLFIVGNVYAAALSASIVKVSQTATSVTVYAEQTGGDPTRLYVEHDCYDFHDDGSYLYVPVKVGFTGSGTFTFATAGRYHGQDWVGDLCGAAVIQNLGSNAINVLAQVDTVP